jgi:endonuclease/exonuclease/phosphatase family metal-dependent hydrolase
MTRARAGALALGLMLAAWFARGYAGEVEAGALEAEPEFGEAFSSRAACEKALAAGRRLPLAPDRVRLGSWNLHWFPDGKPGRKVERSTTDLSWLACAIAWLSVDVLAVQEVKAHASAEQRARELTAELDRLTGGKWRLVLDDCPAAPSQHVGFLFNEARASFVHGRTFAALNPHGEACKDQLRPGYGAYFRFPGGLDLHVVSVHLKSGGERRSFELRERSLRSLKDVYAQARAVEPDQDLLFLGDFNSMGCAHCSPAITPRSELERLSKSIAPAGLRHVPAEPGCSHYFSGQGTLLDLAVISSVTAELPRAERVRVSGVCGALECRKLSAGRRRPAALEALSDHCPILLDLTDRDLD